MKYEIDKQILDVSKSLVASEIMTAKDLYSNEPNFDKKANIGSTISNLKQLYNNLELATKPKPKRLIDLIVNK